MVKDYVVELTRPLDKSMIEVFKQHGGSLVFHDDIIPQRIIVECQDDHMLNNLEFVRSLREAYSDGVLLNPKIAKPKVSLTPGIDLGALVSVGHGFRVKMAVLDCGIYRQVNVDVTEAIDFTGYGKHATEDHGSTVISIIHHIAKATSIYSAKVCHKSGEMHERHVMNALKWARQKQVHIINMSVGWPRECQGNCLVSEYINTIVEVDHILIVAAAGNNIIDEEGNVIEERKVHCPACAEEAISVGAISEEGNGIAPFSSAGHINSNKPNIVTTGHGVLCMPRFFAQFGGTSFAAPVVSGILSVLVSYTGSMETLRMKLYETAEFMEGIPGSKQGLGKLNLPRLLEVLSNEKRTRSEGTQS